MIAAQITGAFLAEFMLYMCFAVFNSDIGKPIYVGINVLCPVSELGKACEPAAVGQFFWVEMWATWVLVAVILTVKYHYDGSESICGPLTVGLTLFVGISWSAETTGGCLNPAVGIANSFFQYAIRKKLFL